MNVQTLYQDLLHATGTLPLTNATAQLWLLVLHTHEIDFSTPLLSNMPDVMGVPAFSLERAASIVSDLWHDRDDVRADEAYWLQCWEQQTPYSYLMDMPSDLRTEVIACRTLLSQDPRLLSVTAIDDRVMSARIPPRDDRPAQDTVLLTSRWNHHDRVDARVPIRFQINNVEFLGTPDDPYMRLPLIDFAPRGMGCLRVAQQYGRAALTFDEASTHLILKRDGTDILVYDTAGGIGVRVAYQVLFATWMDFARDVRDRMWAVHPDEHTRAWWNLITDDPATIPSFVRSVTYESWFHTWDR